LRILQKTKKNKSPFEVRKFSNTTTKMFAEFCMLHKKKCFKNKREKCIIITKHNKTRTNKVEVIIREKGKGCEGCVRKIQPIQKQTKQTYQYINIFVPKQTT